MALHKFKIGQEVGFLAVERMPAPRGTFKIVAKIPDGAFGPQYRVRNKSEAHDRIALERELTLISP